MVVGGTDWRARASLLHDDPTRRSVRALDSATRLQGRAENNVYSFVGNQMLQTCVTRNRYVWSAHGRWLNAVSLLPMQSRAISPTD
jgi:hypothetical protein